MIANFFQSLSRRQVEYLLISGQATVLYGAATFSEDIDLWINPTAENCSRFISALRDCGTRYYKLTPPLAPAHLARGHGFHFVVPKGAELETYLDIMGTPPRVGSFASAMTTAHRMETEWGCLPVIGLKELVELKKTQRVEDYPIMSNLALAWFDRPECVGTPADFLWALENIFTLTALRAFFEEHPSAIEHVAGETASLLKTFGQRVVVGDEVPEKIQEELVNQMQLRMAALQKADRLYWRDIIAELKELRSKDQLVPEGSSV